MYAPLDSQNWYPLILGISQAVLRSNGAPHQGAMTDTDGEAG